MVEGKAETPERSELQKLLLLKGVELESIQGLLEGCSLLEFSENDVVIESGKPNHYLYLLLSGRLRVHLELDGEPIAVLEEGEIVGELSMIDGQPASAYVVADRPCRMLTLGKEIMWSLIGASHTVACNLLYVLAHRLRRGNALISTTQGLQREYERYAIIDALTGLFNRRWLDQNLPRQIKRCKGRQSLCVLVIDIDKFKPYNDTYGHLAGDHVIYTVARTLSENLRPGEMMARYGGDEFVAVLPDVVADEARRIGERLRRAIGEANVGGEEWSDLPTVTLSVGLAEMTSSDTPETLIAKADAALYRAKNAGGNGVSSMDD